MIALAIWSPVRSLNTKNDQPTGKMARTHLRFGAPVSRPMFLLSTLKPWGAAPTTAALAIVATLSLSMIILAAENDELTRAKELYHGAAYDEALSVLDTVAAGTAGPETLDVLEYRVLCLVALDRKEDARKAMTTLVTMSPQYRMSELEAPPRVRAMFAEVRRSLLPAIVQQAYADAKAAFDRRDPDAAVRFDRLLTLLADPDVADNPAMADLATVATGFRDLSRAVGAAPAAAAVTPSSGPGQRAGTAPPVASSTIVPPVAISQTLPRLQVREAREWDGEVEVVIDEAGRVASARMRKSIHPMYDAQLLRAAMNWTYQPALQDGVPAQMMKVVGIHLDSRPECSPQRSRQCRPAAR